MGKIDNILPLEKVLKLCSNNPDLCAKFPDLKRNYFDDYCKSLQSLRDIIYPEINLGLAVLSPGDAAIYTDHSGDHFDDVVRYAGIMLGLSPDDITAPAEVVKILKAGGKWHLDPYEIYLLLCAIRFHDTGNRYGRERHEKKILNVMEEISLNGLPVRVERVRIAKIGEAHGGKAANGSKDTIGLHLEPETEVGQQKIKPQLIASIVRLADEICEGRERATKLPEIPEGNEVFHKYAESIEQCFLHDGNLSIHYSINKEDSVCLFGKNKDETYLTDEIFIRLEKMELERRYCNMFLPPELQVRTLSVKVEIWEVTMNEYKCMVHQEILKDAFQVSETGYPADLVCLSKMRPGLTGKCLCEKFS